MKLGDPFSPLLMRSSSFRFFGPSPTVLSIPAVSLWELPIPAASRPLPHGSVGVFSIKLSLPVPVCPLPTAYRQRSLILEASFDELLFCLKRFGSVNGAEPNGSSSRVRRSFPDSPPFVAIIPVDRACESDPRWEPQYETQRSDFISSGEVTIEV